ncbi:MAG TPA: hypothetical protein VIJ14_08615, partial [Rhabdochlamydiaceae bacterium]
FGPAPVITGGNGVQEASVNNGAQQAQHLADFAGSAPLHVPPGTDLMQFADVPVIGGSSSGLPQDTSLMNSSDQVAANSYVAPLISGSPDRSPQQTPRSATPASSDDEGSGFFATRRGSRNILANDFPFGGSFANWYPSDDQQDI